ncbi:MAG: hypothetical protein AAGA32_07465 [Pseudomonadota bacterium]
MNILIGTVLIWAAALWVIRRLAREEGRMTVFGRRARETFLYILPRVAVGLLSAGFLAALLPEERVEALFGASAGVLGLLLASVFGAITPGGPFVVFAIGASALKAGASEGAIVAYVSAWSVVCITRTLTYEVAMMGAAFTRVRILVSLPVPIILGLIVNAIG